LSPGQQLSQSCHALAQFAIDHSEIFQAWTKGSNYLCCLSTNRDNLKYFAQEVEYNHSVFKEPFFKNRLTAICIEPLPESIHNSLYKQLKLALK